MGNSNTSPSRLIQVPMVTDRRRQNAPMPPEAAAALVFSVMDNKLKEFKQCITAGETVVSEATFIASSESMEVGWHIPQLASVEVLQPGQLYFLLPISYLQCPLSIHDLCDMAVKVAAALGAKRKNQSTKGSVNPMEANMCYPMPDVTHLVHKVEKLRLLSRSSTLRK